MVLASVETCLAISVTFGRSLKLSEPTDPPSHQDGKHQPWREDQVPTAQQLGSQSFEAGEKSPTNCDLSRVYFLGEPEPGFQEIVKIKERRKMQKEHGFA